MKRDAAPHPRVGYLVKWVERGLRVRLDAALHPWGVSAHEYTALSVLSRRDGLSSAQLARRTLVSAQAMNQLVISLERRALIVRKADPEHRKIQRASLTAAGRKLVVACDRATEQVEAHLVSELSAREITEFRRTLSKCVASLQSNFDSRKSENAAAASD